MDLDAQFVGLHLPELSRVLEIDTKSRTVSTATGTVRAQELVMATHTPKGIRLVHAEMPVHREYAVAMRAPFPDPGPGIFWAQGDESLSVPYEELVRDRFVIGTPDECRAELQRYHDVLGVNHFLLRPQWPGMPQKLVLDQIELLGQHVFPALR